MQGQTGKRYLKQADLLVRECIARVYRATSKAPSISKSRIVVGLPYEAADHKNTMIRMIRKISCVESCDVVAQAAGTMVAMNKSDGPVVSIGQGTSEIVMLEKGRVIDGQSLEWASEFITRKVGRFAHLDTKLLLQHKDICAKYARTLAENLSVEVLDMVTTHGYDQDRHGSREIVFSGGGILIPRVRQELESRLKGFDMVVPEDPVMSNAEGLYKLAR